MPNIVSLVHTKKACVRCAESRCWIRHPTNRATSEIEISTKADIANVKLVSAVHHRSSCTAFGFLDVKADPMLRVWSGQLLEEEPVDGASWQLGGLSMDSRVKSSLAHER